MFRRSFLIFLAFCFLALVLTVGYAVTGLSGPQTAIREANQALRQRRPDQALRILAQAEHSLGPHATRAQRNQILTIRYRAHLATRNFVRAYMDLERLVEESPEKNLGLGRELVRTLILADEPQKAIAHASRMLRTFPEDGRILELAGEACQKLYQEKLGELSRDLVSNLPPVRYREAIDGLLPYLYRSETDPVAINGKRTFQSILKTYDPQAHTGRVYNGVIDEVRELISNAQRYYRRAMEVPGTPVAAYRGMAYALKQGQRSDDLIALSEVYLRRFDHVYTIPAAVNALRAHADAGRHGAVIELANRVVPTGSWKRRIKTQRFSPETREIYFLKGKALYALQDAEGLAELAADLTAMAELTPFNFETELAFIQAYEKELLGDNWGVDKLLGPLSWNAKLRDYKGAGEDLYVQAFKLRLTALERANASEPLEQYQRIVKLWIQTRPDDPEPLLRRTRYHIASNSPDLAFYDASKLYRLTRAMKRKHEPIEDVETLSSDDLAEEALRLLATATDMMFAQSNRGARALLDQCLQLQIPTPREVAKPELYLALARLALDEGNEGIAHNAATRSTQLFSWARWPRYLWAEAMMRSGQYREVAQKMETLRELHPEDAQALRLVREARRRANKNNDHMMFDVAMTGESDPELATFLVRRCIQREDWETARMFAQHAVPEHGSDPKIPLLVARTLEGAGDIEGAEKVLAPWLRFLTEVPDEVAGRIVEQYLRLVSPGVASKKLLGYVAAASELYRDDADALLRVAEMLAENGHRVPAYELIRPVLEDSRHRGSRRGRHYVLAGMLALAAEMPEAAEDHLTAALAFPDGGEASRWLALLFLRDGRVEEASNAFWDTEADDLSTAALAVRLGRPEAAERWIRETLDVDVSNVGASCLLALANPNSKPIPAIAELIEEDSSPLLDTLMFSGVEGLEQDALDHATVLQAAFPKNPVAGYLYAQRLAAEGDTALAIGILTAAARQDYLPAFDELLRVLRDTDPKMASDPGLQATIQQLVRKHGNATPPGLRAVALSAIANQLTRQEEVSQADLDTLAKLWLEYPTETEASLVQVHFLINARRWRDATALTERLFEFSDPDDQQATIRDLARTLRAIIIRSQDPEVRDEIIALVRKHLAAEGPFGALVHLHLDQLYRTAGGSRRRVAREDLAEERKLLESHIDLFLAGGDHDVASLRLSLTRLSSIDGPHPTLERIDQVLQADASLLPIWMLRAELLEVTGHPDRALESLRWLEHYIDSPEILLERCRIAGQHGVVIPEDEERLFRLPEPFASSPDAALARGLLALRNGQYEEAGNFLSKAPPRPDGAHVYYRALALLSIPTPEAGDEARSLLEDYQTNFERGGLSEIAGHLANELALPTGTAGESVPEQAPGEAPKLIEELPDYLQQAPKEGEEEGEVPPDEGEG